MKGPNPLSLNPRTSLPGALGLGAPAQGLQDARPRRRAPGLLTWQWGPRGKLRRPGLGRRRVQERGAQLRLPQALVRWGQHWGGPWWLEVVEGSLWRGDPSLGLGGQRWLLRSPYWGEPARSPWHRSCSDRVVQRCLGMGGAVSFFKETLAGTGLGSTRRGSPHARPTCLPPPSRKDQAVRAWDPCPKADPNLTGGGLRSRLRS